jgi:hypothetical protein
MEQPQCSTSIKSHSTSSPLTATPADLAGRPTFAAMTPAQRATELVARMDVARQHGNKAKTKRAHEAANLAYDAIDWQLECWKTDEDDMPPSDLLNAHAALYGLLRYARDPEDNSDDLPF